MGGRTTLTDPGNHPLAAALLDEAVCFATTPHTYGPTMAHMDRKEDAKQYRAWRSPDPIARSYAELVQFSPAVAQDWMRRLVGLIPLQGNIKGPLAHMQDLHSSALLAIQLLLADAQSLRPDRQLYVKAAGHSAGCLTAVAVARAVQAWPQDLSPAPVLLRAVLVAPGMAPSLLEFTRTAPTGVRQALVVATHPSDTSCPTAAHTASDRLPAELALFYATGLADKFLFDWNFHATELLIPMLLTGIHQPATVIGEDMIHDMLVSRAAGLLCAVLALPLACLSPVTTELRRGGPPALTRLRLDPREQLTSVFAAIDQLGAANFCGCSGYWRPAGLACVGRCAGESHPGSSPWR